MNPPTYSQPDPYPQGVPTTPVARPTPQSNRKFIPIVAGVVLAIVAFAGGFAVANATASNTGAGRSANLGGDANGQGFPGASGRLRNGFGGGGAGTVSSVAADQMTITTQSGGSRIVLLTPTTTVTEVTSTPKTTSDIASGTTVTVVGSSNPDGSVTATRVIIGDAGVFGRGPGGGGGNGAPAPSTAP
jgi:hypothetical protein